MQNDATGKKPEDKDHSKRYFSAPAISRVTAANFPHIVNAGKPIIKIDSSNGGAPVFSNYNTEQGLAESIIFCSFTDEAGNLWFGTNGGGVSKYDGKSFTNYTTANGLANNTINGITQDRKRNIWFSTDGGLSKYDGYSFTNYTTACGLVNNHLRSIMLDKSGNIWFGSNGGGVSKYDGKSFINYTTNQGLASNLVFSSIQDKAGNLWFGTYGMGVSKYDGKSFTNYTTAQGLANNIVRCIIEDKTGNLWFGTNGGGVSKYDGKSFKNYTTDQGLAGNLVFGGIQDKAGNLWFGTNKGVSKYDGNVFTNYATSQGLASNNVWSIIMDKTGNLWFGTGGGGVCKYEGNSFTRYTTRYGLAGNLIFSIQQDNAGNLWFGTSEKGVSKYDGQNFTNYTTAQGLPVNTVKCVMADKTGNLWFGTDSGGVSKYDGKSFTNYTPAQGLAGYNIMSIIQDKAGNLWVGTYGNGVSKYDGQNFTNYTTAQGLPGDSIESIIQDRAGNLWFGTDGGGVSKYDGKSFTNYTITQGLVSDRVSSIIEDRKGNLWFGTYGSGVSKYNGKGFTNYTTAQGLADNMIYSIVEDSIRNIIWFGTNLGLSGLKQTVSSNSNAQDDVFEIFNNSTGYPIKNLNANAMFLDNKGILWAGCGDKKLIRFDYGALNKNTEPLRLEIQNVKVNNENICWNNLLRTQPKNKTEDSLVMLNEMVTTFGGVLLPAVLDSIHKKYADIKFNGISRFYPVPFNLVLPYEDNNISFDYVAIEPAMAKHVKYQYKLEGFDKDWTPLSNKTSADFGDIREGNYTFKLKALSPFGVWSETEYKFKVLTPWQRTWWAYTLYALVFLIALHSFIKWRTKTLKKEKILIEEKIAIRTLELRKEKEKVESTLQELNSTQAQLIQREKMASLGELTAGIAHEIENPLNFVNNFSEVSKELIEELRQEKNKGNGERIEEEILTVIEQNLEKVIHHGKRADAIVKGMLQHSSVSKGQKEPININDLASEYLRLSYHGFRAKDVTFNVTIQTYFDDNIEKINMIPQDIGRVLLNLYNNAFYAVNEKKKSETDGYEPRISVSTKKLSDKIEIRIKDNGDGISQKVLSKIFQPFFTTKPTGQGTGLGLSLSYDIIKAHGGELKVETQEGAGAEFIVLLRKQ